MESSWTHFYFLTLSVHVKCTSADIFRVQPPLGFIKSNEAIQIRIWFQILLSEFLENKDVPNSHRHYFAIYHMKCSEGKTIKETWTKSAKPDGLGFGKGDRSTVATLSVDMMAAELASRYKVDNIYMQTGNMHIRPLSGDARPLYILREYLCWMGYLDTEMEGKGISMNFRNMIAFFLGRPTLQPNSSIRSEIRMAECEVRRGKVVHRWTKHKCILYNGNIRIQRDSGEDEVLQISRYRVDIYESRKGRCLRLFDIHSTILFLFDDHETLMLWLTRTQQPRIPDILSAFPYLTEWLFAGNYAETVGCHPAALGNLSKVCVILITYKLVNINNIEEKLQLDLRRNALTNSFRLPNISYDKLTHIDIRDNCHVSTVHLTNVPSLQVLHCERLQLTSLHLNGQNLSHLYADHNLLESLIVMPMPLNILQINISYNNFDILPDWICDLPQLSHLNVSNNKLTALPDRALRSLTLLEDLNLSSNRLSHLSPAITQLPALQVLRAHSNLILSMPDLSQSLTLQVELCIRRFRFGNLFGLIDGGSNYELPKTIHNTLKEQYQEKFKIIIVVIVHKRSTSSDLLTSAQRMIGLGSNLRLTILSAHEQLGEQGERLGANELTQRSLSTIPPPDPATSREEDTKLYLKVQHEIGTENSMLRQENKHQMGISIPKLNNNLKSEHSQDNTREKFGNYSELLEYSQSGRYNIRQAEKRSLEQRHIERINQVYNYHTSIQSSANLPKAHTIRDSQSDNSLSKETRTRAPSDVFSSECSSVRIHERRMSVIDETPEQQERSENRELLKGDQIVQDVQDSLRLEIPKKDKITLDL
uniref:MSP domain-containing protein n=1 Tax=Heterorhabditis bacteriophora TaxID=37862 RepID=A0A1I7W9P8_HETBA